MKKFFTLISLIAICQLSSAQPNWKNIRPSNTGFGGDYFICIEADQCGNKWSGGYLPFWSEGSVVRFDDSVFTNWSNFEGYIPADRVYGIAFDQNNGVWVATNDLSNGIAHGGISHYDGVNWQTWTTLNSPLPEDNMRAITVDNNNNVWATFWNPGTGNGGIAKYDGAIWTIFNSGTQGIPNTFIDKIACDNLNNIWVGTSQGLLKYNGSSWFTYNTTNGLSNVDVHDVEFDASTNKLYIATGIAIDVFDGTSWTHINNSNAPVSMTGLWAVAARNDSIIITSVGGSYLTYIYDGTTWINHPEGDHTYDACIDADGNFWTAGNGVIRKYDGVNWTDYLSKNTGMTGMFNWDIYTDSKNRVWLGSADNGGINVYDCRTWQAYNPYNGGMWPQPIMYTGSGTGITEDSYGDIWMVYNGVAGGVVRIPAGDINSPQNWVTWETANAGVSLQFLFRTAADHSGNVWFGYDQVCSVSRYSHITNAWTNFNLFQLGQITCGAGSGINSIRTDEDDNVWICGDAGLAKYDTNAVWTFYSHLNTPMQQGMVMDIAFDATGNRWIATEDGLYKFDASNNWTTYTTTNAGLFGNMISCLQFDNSGTLWVGNSDPVFPYPAGLSSFDGNAWNQYTPQNSGLPEKWVERLALDTAGNLWVMTPGHGIAVHNPNGVVGFDCIDHGLDNCITTSLPETFSKNQVTLNIFPNPANEYTTLKFTSINSSLGKIELSDMSGRILKEIPVKISSGNNEWGIKTDGLKPGVYFIRLLSIDLNAVTRLIVHQ